MKRGGIVAGVICASVLALALSDRDAAGEDMTCLGWCRTDYGACLMSSKGDTPEAQAKRTECGRAYVKCAASCRAAK
jgi:hypothetical protein